MAHESLNDLVRRLAERNRMTPREPMAFAKRVVVFPVSTTDDVIQGLCILSDRDFGSLSSMGAHPSSIDLLDQFGGLADEVRGQPVFSRHRRERLKAV